MKSLYLIILAILLTLPFTLSLEVTCKYSSVGWGAHFAEKIYECNIQDKLVITDRSQTITKVSGEHAFLNSLEDVTGVHMKDKTINYLPSGYGKFFTALLGLSVENCGLKELTQKDLKEFPKLQHIWIFKNSVEVLEKGLFEFNPDLIYINFNSNKIKEIYSKIFDNLKVLKVIEITKNACIDMKTSKDTTLKALIAKVKASCSIKNETEAEDVEKPEPETTTNPATKMTSKIAATTQKIETEATTKKTSFLDKLKEREKSIKKEESNDDSNLNSSYWTKAAIGGSLSLIVVAAIIILAVKVVRRSRAISDSSK